MDTPLKKFGLSITKGLSVAALLVYTFFFAATSADIDRKYPDPNEPWSPIPSDRECTADKAGKGKSIDGVCYDFVKHGWRGPLLVVIPAGDEFDKPFAIGRYELSKADWSKYCALSGICEPERKQARLNDPQTGITIEQVNEYAIWLSQRTGNTYRIPTKVEWLYAADAKGQQANKDVNCLLILKFYQPWPNAKTMKAGLFSDQFVGIRRNAVFRQAQTSGYFIPVTKRLKGPGATSVKDGPPNGWGLRNYIGNVQEWVFNGDEVLAMGGHFEVRFSQCELSYEQSHDGSADNMTGVRLVREELDKLK